MNLWDMSISGGILIAVIVIIRSLLRNRLPGRVFRVLWLAAFLRLMIPFSVPWQLSIYSLAENVMEFSGWEKMKEEASENEAAENIIPGSGLSESEAAGSDLSVFAGERALYSGWMLIYLAGAGLCAFYYIISYARWHREFQTALPIEEPEVQAWADILPLRRKVHIRQWEMTSTPLTYGIVHPVILLPKALAKEADERLRFVLVHEYMHIRHFDAVKKMFLVLLSCVHWFNPLVWVMLILANRDIELECDEHVLRYLGGDMRAAYAHTLIDLEEQKGPRISWGNSFSKNAMEERVFAIMKERKKSIAIGVLSGVLTAGIILVFATSAAAVSRVEQDAYAKADERAAETTYNIDQVEQMAGTDYADASDTIPVDEQTINEQYLAEAQAVEEQAAEKAHAYDADSRAAAEEAQRKVVYENVEGDHITTVTVAPGRQENETIAHANAQSSGDSSASEQVIGNNRIEVPTEYASYGITSNPGTGAWEYQGKRVAVLYDRGIFTLADDASGKRAAYLEVRRNKKGEIEEIKELSKKEMQELLKETGLVIE